MNETFRYFPLYQDPDEEMLTFIGQFYSKSNHLKPREILLPSTVDAEIVRQLLDVNVYIPQRGKKKSLVDLAIKNAKISLSEKFQLIERQELANNWGV